MGEVKHVVDLLKILEGIDKLKADHDVEVTRLRRERDEAKRSLEHALECHEGELAELHTARAELAEAREEDERQANVVNGLTAELAEVGRLCVVSGTLAVDQDEMNQIMVGRLALIRERLAKRNRREVEK